MDTNLRDTLKTLVSKLKTYISGEIGNAVLTIKQNNTSLGTFTANASSNVDVNITTPIKTSDLENDGEGGSPEDKFVLQSEIIQSDWDETDDKENSFILHRTHYTYIETVTKDSKTITFTDNGTYAVGNGWGYAQHQNIDDTFVEGKQIIVTVGDEIFEDTVHRVVNPQIGLSDCRYIGNGHILNSDIADTGETWCIGSTYYGNNAIYFYVDQSLAGSQLVSFKIDEELVQCLPDKFLSINIPRKSEVATNLLNGDATGSVARVGLASNLIGQYSFSFNSSATGNHSVAFGSGVGGDRSFSANQGVVLKASDAVALNLSTAAQGNSLAVGQTEARSNQFTFGHFNIIDDLSEYNLWVSGTSYSVGDRVKYYDSNYEVSDGKYILYECNVDNTDTYFNPSHWNILGSKYLEIVGNGVWNARSNARTLDWSGNETLAGSITVGKNLTVGSSSTPNNGYIHVYNDETYGGGRVDIIAKGEETNTGMFGIITLQSTYGINGGSISLISTPNPSNHHGGDIYLSAIDGGISINSSSVTFDSSSVTFNGTYVDFRNTGAIMGIKKPYDTTTCTPDTYYCPQTSGGETSITLDDSQHTGDYNYTFSGYFTNATSSSMSQMPPTTSSNIAVDWFGDSGLEAGKKYMFCCTKVSATLYVGVVTKLN